MNYIKRIKQNAENQKDQAEIIRLKLVIQSAAKNFISILVDEIQAKKRNKKSVRPTAVTKPPVDNTFYLVTKKKTE
jgi:hypothetical protein